MIDRFGTDPEISALSSFSDIQTAERAVDIVLEALELKIVRLQGGRQSKTSKKLDVRFVVRVVVDPVTLKATETAWVDLHLVADPSIPELKYYILTGFPIPARQ